VSRIETIGSATLYLGDCREILPTLGNVDAVVTDPPYGISYKPYQPDAVEHSAIVGDDAAFDPSHLIRSAGQSIIWGGNNFANQLPKGGWLCWDKRTNEDADRMMGSPFELAWHSKPTTYKMVRILHGGTINADGHGIPRLHPTQKPIRLMEWCIGFVTGDTILDPYMGTGTTGVAAVKLGRKFIGIEIETKYFDIACRRIQAAVDAPDMFIERPPEPKQETWNEMWKEPYHKEAKQ